MDPRDKHGQVWLNRRSGKRSSKSLNTIKYTVTVTCSVYEILLSTFNLGIFGLSL